MDDTVLLYDVFDAYYDARRNKRNTKSQLAFEMNLEHNLLQLYEELRTRTYKPSPCTCFITFDPVNERYLLRRLKIGLCITCCSTILPICLRKHLYTIVIRVVKNAEHLWV